jgi:hypothetical protein
LQCEVKLATVRGRIFFQQHRARAKNGEFFFAYHPLILRKQIHFFAVQSLTILATTPSTAHLILQCEVILATKKGVVFLQRHRARAKKMASFFSLSIL